MSAYQRKSNALVYVSLAVIIWGLATAGAYFFGSSRNDRTGQATATENVPPSIEAVILDGKRTAEPTAAPETGTELSPTTGDTTSADGENLPEGAIPPPPPDRN